MNFSGKNVYGRVFKICLEEKDKLDPSAISGIKKIVETKYPMCDWNAWVIQFNQIIRRANKKKATH